MNDNLNLAENRTTDFPIIMLKKYPQRRRNHQSFRYNEYNRIMSKRGRLNVCLSNIPEKSLRYVRDLWNTLVNLRWRWLIFIVALVNALAYLILGSLFFLDAWFSDDFNNNNNNNDTNHKYCMRNQTGFISFFMLGIETITTTGYGYFYLTENCKFFFITLLLGTLAMIFIDGAFISVVYAKIAKPTYKTNIFSKKAVITLRNGIFCFIFRINDRFGKHWIDTKINLFLITTSSKTKQGEVIAINYTSELQIEPVGVLFWPVDIVHEIYSQSPLWNLSPKDLLTEKLEFLVVITGSSIVTGQNSQSQTSFVSKEILWGYKFIPCLEYSNAKKSHIVNRHSFNKTVAHNMPLSSANHLSNVEKDINK